MDTSEGLGTLGTPNNMLESLRKRYNAAKYVADLWIPVMQASFFYAVPWRNRYYLPGKEFQGTVQNTRVYDTTAVSAVKTFVSKIHDTLTPPGMQWAFLEVDTAKMEDAENRIDEIETAQLILDKYMRQMFNYIHKTNFDSVINENYYDLAVGTSCIVINQLNDEVPFYCTSVPCDKLAIEEAANGKIETWFRTWQLMKIAELNTRWPKIKLTADLINTLSSDIDASVRNLYEGCMYVPNEPKPYLYAVWYDNSVLYYEWLEINPGIVWRWQKVNNETWGRGPVMDALPSIISLNEMARVELAAANLNVFRPYMGFSDAVFNPYTFRLEPFSVIPIAPIGAQGQVPLIPLPPGSDANFTQMTIADLRLQIKTLLFAEEPQDTVGIQPQTKYELSLKRDNLAERIGPIFARTEYEYIYPIFKRIQYILNKMGLLPIPKLEGIPIKFRYQSPLALVKGQENIGRLLQGIQIIQGIYGADATAVYINAKNTPYMIFKSLQIDDRYLNTPEQVAEVMQTVQDQENINKLANMGGGQEGQGQEPVIQ